MKEKLESIYREYGPGLFTCALAVTRRPEMAEDAVHEAFCRLMRRFDRGAAPPDNLKTYVFSVVRNAAIDLARREAATPSAAPSGEEDGCVLDTSDNPRQAAEKREFLEQAAQALETLSSDQKETVVQHLWAGLTFREISDMRQRPLGTVTAWYRRGVARMREEMGE